MPIFFTKESCNRGMYPPQMPLTVNERQLHPFKWITDLCELLQMVATTMEESLKSFKAILIFLTEI